MQKKMREQFIKLLKTVSLFVFYYAMQYIILIPLIFIYRGKDIDEATYNLVFSVVFAIILFIIYRNDLQRDFKDFVQHNESYIKKNIKYWFIGLFIMVVSNGIINSISPDQIAGNEAAIRELIRKSPVIMMVSTIILAPFVEELLFRKTLYDLIKNKWILVLASTLLFGSAHVFTSYEKPMDLLYAIPYGALGGAFAYMYYKSKNIFTSMIIHAIHNAILVFLFLVLVLMGL